MQRIVKFIDKLLGRTGVHITDTSFKYIKKNVDRVTLPYEGQIIYFGLDNYEVSSIIHNYENFRHTIFIVVVPLENKIIADVNISFDKDGI